MHHMSVENVSVTQARLASKLLSQAAKAASSDGYTEQSIDLMAASRAFLADQIHIIPDDDASSFVITVRLFFDPIRYFDTLNAAIKFINDTAPRFYVAEIDVYELFLPIRKGRHVDSLRKTDIGTARKIPIQYGL